jgi:hypothetical protein
MSLSLNIWNVLCWNVNNFSEPAVSICAASDFATAGTDYAPGTPVELKLDQDIPETPMNAHRKFVVGVQSIQAGNQFPGQD